MNCMLKDDLLRDSVISDLLATDNNNRIGDGERSAFADVAREAQRTVDGERN
jgi:hypothetical protein